MARIRVNHDTSIEIDEKEFWENQNKIKINLYGEKIQNYRIIHLDNEIYLLIPEKLVPRPVIEVKPTIVERKTKKKKQETEGEQKNGK